MQGWEYFSIDSEFSIAKIPIWWAQWNKQWRKVHIEKSSVLLKFSAPTPENVSILWLCGIRRKQPSCGIISRSYINLCNLTFRPMLGLSISKLDTGAYLNQQVEVRRLQFIQGSKKNKNIKIIGWILSLIIPLNQGPKSISWWCYITLNKFWSYRQFKDIPYLPKIHVYFRVCLLAFKNLNPFCAFWLKYQTENKCTLCASNWYFRQQSWVLNQ